MKRLISLILIVSFAASSNTYEASAAIKAGSTCKTKGETKVVASSKFTCTKTGKKLVWVLKISKPNPTPSNSPKNEEPSPTFPTSLANLKEYFEGIPYSAWSDVQKKLELNPLPKTSVSITYGSNTKARYSEDFTKEKVFLGSRVMSSFPQPSEVRFYEFNKLDVNWGKEEASKYVSPFKLGQSFSNQAELLCSGEDCDGAVTNYASGVGLVLVGVSTPINRYGDISRFKGQNDLHEYVHAVQGIIFAGKQTSPPPTLLPCWYSEGQPQAVSILTSSSSIKDYLNVRRGWMKDNRWMLPDMTSKSIETFLADNMKTPCPQSTNSLNYTVGYIALEALISVGGVDSTFELLNKVADGKTFKEAFEMQYQMSWEKAAPILADVISRAFIEAKK